MRERREKERQTETDRGKCRGEQRGRDGDSQGEAALKMQAGRAAGTDGERLIDGQTSTPPLEQKRQGTSPTELPTPSSIFFEPLLLLLQSKHQLSSAVEEMRSDVFNFPSSQICHGNGNLG
jgi:hypothetical protein